MQWLVRDNMQYNWPDQLLANMLMFNGAELGVQMLQWTLWWRCMWCRSSSSRGGGSGRSTVLRRGSESTAGRLSTVHS